MVVISKTTTLVLVLIITFSVGIYSLEYSRNMVNQTTEYEHVLAKQGFLLNLDKTLFVNDTQITIAKVLFDIDSITFIFKNNNNLSSMDLTINGNTDPENKIDEFGNIKTCITPSSALFGEEYQFITLPHHFKLMNQQIIVTISYNGSQTTFKLDYPGDRIAEQTRVYMFDNNGNVQNSTSEAEAICVVGINYTLIKTKNVPLIGILDTNTNRMLKKSFMVSTENTMSVYEPLLFPRDNIEIQYDFHDKIVKIH